MGCTLKEIGNHDARSSPFHIEFKFDILEKRLMDSARHRLIAAPMGCTFIGFATV
jgi:hypothetical protein